jgi:hypothetical protein
MSRSILNVMVLVALILLAGCSGLSGLGSEPPEVSVTPADVPTNAKPATPSEQIAPGVLPTGVYNASALAHAHARILGSTSFTIRTNRTYRYQNGTLARWITGIQRVESGPPLRIQTHSRYHIQRLYPQRSNVSIALESDLWFSLDNGYQRTTYANNTTRYSTLSQRIRSINSPILTRAWRINKTLSNVDTQVTRHTRNGSTYYRIKGPVPHGNPSPLLSSNKQNSSQWLLIDSRGVIHEYHITVYTSGPKETAIKRHFSITFRKIGNTTVERPAWVETARNRTTPANRTETASRQNSSTTE